MTMLTLTLLAEAPLNYLSALEIGGNKTYINHGLLRHEVETILVPQLQTTLKGLKAASEGSLQLAVSGFILSLLEKYEPEVLAELQLFVKEKNVTLLKVPYYGTSLHVLSSQELKSQLALEEDALQKFFKKRSDGFFSSDGIIPKGLRQTKIFVGKEIQGEVALSTLTRQVIATPCIAIGTTPLVKSSFSEMEEHLVDEYKALTPHIFATQDDSLLAEWRLLGQTAMFTKADAQIHTHESYDHYANYMNTLNDIAHKIRTVELGKQGLFATNPQIVASPSRLLEELR